mmetsp:Transcript_68704/g.212417  ORF Transcript_68704/g.212417 Transcript_68704/m.212417 type:complete len:215 (+) Transcript_68704:159-803(+)
MVPSGPGGCRERHFGWHLHGRVRGRAQYAAGAVPDQWSAAGHRQVLHHRVHGGRRLLPRRYPGEVLQDGARDDRLAAAREREVQPPRVPARPAHRGRHRRREPGQESQARRAVLGPRALPPGRRAGLRRRRRGHAEEAQEVAVGEGREGEELRDAVPHQPLHGADGHRLCGCDGRGGPWLPLLCGEPRYLQQCHHFRGVQRCWPGLHFLHHFDL